MNLIDGRKIAEKIEKVLRQVIQERAVALSVASIFVGEANDSALYTKRKSEAAARLGIKFFVERLPASVSAKEIEEKIKEMNERPDIDGYIMQLPLPELLRPETDRLLNLIEPSKDIDGLTQINRQALFDKKPSAFLPTPVAAVREIINSQYDEAWESKLQVVAGKLSLELPPGLSGKKAVIISDGVYFAPVVDFVLSAGGMRAGVVTSRYNELRQKLQTADFLISAIGKPAFITGQDVSAGAVVIDVGTTLVQGRTVGDIDRPSVSQKAAACTPVPGGVGPVTVAMLFANALYLKIISSLNKNTPGVF